MCLLLEERSQCPWISFTLPTELKSSSPLQYLLLTSHSHLSSLPTLAACHQIFVSLNGNNVKISNDCNDLEEHMITSLPICSICCSALTVTSHLYQHWLLVTSLNVNSIKTSNNYSDLKEHMITSLPNWNICSSAVTLTSANIGCQSSPGPAACHTCLSIRSYTGALFTVLYTVHCTLFCTLYSVHYCAL